MCLHHSIHELSAVHQWRFFRHIFYGDKQNVSSPMEYLQFIITEYVGCIRFDAKEYWFFLQVIQAIYTILVCGSWCFLESQKRRPKRFLRCLLKFGCKNLNCFLNTMTCLRFTICSSNILLLHFYILLNIT